MILDEVSPNGWQVLIELIKMLGAVCSSIVAAYLILHKRQSDRIETLVNGNLHREQQDNIALRSSNEALRAKLDAAGIDHTDA